MTAFVALTAWAARPYASPAPFDLKARYRHGDGFNVAEILAVGAVVDELVETVVYDAAAKTFRISGTGVPIPDDDVLVMVSGYLAEAVRLLRADAEPPADATPAEFRAYINRHRSGDSELLAEITERLAITASALRGFDTARRLALRTLKDGPLNDPAWREWFDSSALDAEEDALSAFLGAYDGAPTVRRSDLGRAYTSAGSPGGLSVQSLYEAAVSRWGAAVKSSGTYVYRPASRPRV